MKRLCLTVAALLLIAAPAAAQRTLVSRDFPVYNNAGRPDLTIDPQRFVAQMEIVDRLFDPVDDACAFDEGVIGGPGYRRLLRFDTVIMNAGDADLVIGDRSDPNNPYAAYFVYSACHGHYHIRNFSVYQLLRPDGSVAAEGHKQGFCLTDSFKYGDNKSNGYDCHFQGITSGWGDWYIHALLKGLVTDVKHLPSRQNLFIAAVGGGLALAVHPLDDNVNRKLVGNSTAETFFKAGEVLGELGTLLGSAATVYAVGRIKDEPKVSHLGMDLIRAMAISEGLTQTLKYATRRERPDHRARIPFHQGTQPTHLRSPRRWSAISAGVALSPRTRSRRTWRSPACLRIGIGSAMRSLARLSA